jgi:hypothetical protein
MNMSLLYKDQKDIKTLVEVKHLPDGKISFLFTCDGGKFGTDEIIDEYKVTQETLLEILQNYFNPE